MIKQIIRDSYPIQWLPFYSMSKTVTIFIIGVYIFSTIPSATTIGAELK